MDCSAHCITANLGNRTGLTPLFTGQYHACAQCKPVYDLEGASKNSYCSLPRKALTPSLLRSRRVRQRHQVAERLYGTDQVGRQDQQARVFGTIHIWGQLLDDERESRLGGARGRQRG